MIAFLALLFVLLVIYALTKTKEGFNPMNTSPEHRINIPVNEIPPMLTPANMTKNNTTVGNTVSQPASNGSIFPGCDVKSSTYPGMLPGPLPTAPYEQIAVGSPLPYQDTTLIKANRQQLINLLEMMKGFLAYEAQEIAERSDPTIQLPLQTARTDFHVLQQEVEVLNRNPGIQPTITLSHLNEISSNLAFLQREVRLIGSAGPIQGPIYEFTKPVEGFAVLKKKSQTDAPAASTKLAKPVSSINSKALPCNTSSSAAPKPTQLNIMPSKPEKITEKVTVKETPNQQYTSRATANDNASYNTATFGTIPLSSLDLRPTATTNARDPKKPDVIPPKAEKITVLDTKADTAKVNAQKGVVTTLLNDTVSSLKGLMPANMPAGPSDAASKSGNSGPASFNSAYASSSNGHASLKELEDFIVRINCESVRLSSSGTSDPNMNARIVALADIKSSINDIINQVKLDPTMEANIPITSAELEKALPVLGKPSEPLPQLIKKENFSPGLANLLPSNMQNDPKVSREIGNLANKYLDTLVNGMSFSVSYTSPREAVVGRDTTYNSLPGMYTDVQSDQELDSMAEKQRRSKSTIETTGFPSMADLDNASNAKFSPMDSGLLLTDRYAPLPSDAGRGPSHFDWKARSKEIEAQVKKRGLHPKDFGIMDAKAKISDEFSWRGYARMICTRLQATMDPNLPVACGCPPMDWPGWRNAK